ncbi:YidH family protein [Histidinibacterium aquaticum]|uniref:DUF202 domain-containing protein n=1 Tax=Histidinibacterium aquaticum TaxID=2613962 RepID=A0A5J5GAX7_9RHOB|nr:DUF202 domain-containing protein [Histidinibacterium aquaticum]KAA9005266.1 DUF202 domain-containing protein [Histidinibacterium aquaticum]
MSPKDDMARDRTDWAEDRTILANERTFAGWMRTGMTSLVVALGSSALFAETEPAWIAKTVASVFVLVAITVFAAGLIESRRAQLRIKSHVTAPQPAKRLTFVAVILTLGAMGIGVIIWMI